MKKALYILPLPILLLLFWSFSAGYAPQKTKVAIEFNYTLADTSLLKPEAVHLKKTILLANLIIHNHYSKKPLSDDISKQMFNRYLSDLDDSRMYFFNEDINKFTPYETQLDDMLQEGNLDLAYTIFNIYKQRVLERMKENIDMLLSDEEFDFKKDEYLNTDRENVAWAKNKAELDDVWRKQIKNSVLGLMLSDKTQAEAKEIIKTRFETYQRNINQMKSEDVFETYMNSLTETYDPHTAYFSPINSQNFQMNMNKSFEGIGARLQTQSDHTVITEIMPGGPAFRNKELNANDKIIGVAQGDDGEVKDVIGWRINDVVALIRGEKGSVVRLQIISASAGTNEPPKIVRLVRDKINIEDQSASKKMYEITEKGKTLKIGVITIPSFYINFEEYRQRKPDYKGTTNDTKKLIQELEAEGMDALVIDLRYNGGGALQEAIDLTGLFIKTGPVVQVRDTKGDIDVSSDENPLLVYEGPLVVMVNSFSASASEIFAGAIQDYKRGLIIGEQTFGKGTVQSQIDLNRYVRDSDEDLGQLNLTLSKFYRITGSSTQHQGVIPDIQMPSIYGRDKVGESAQPNALAWDEIKSARFTAVNQVTPSLVNKLKKSYEKRLQTDPSLKDLMSYIEESRELQERAKISLNLEKRRVESEEYKKKAETRAKLLEQSAVTEGSYKDIKDAYLKNTLHIIVEMKSEEGKKE
jgi:carboxyl-terminal processing protease